MNNRIKHLRSLIKRQRLADNELLKMPIGKNSKIVSKAYLTEDERLKLSRKYLEYYRREHIKNLKIALISVALTIVAVSLLIYTFMMILS